VATYTMFILGSLDST